MRALLFLLLLATLIIIPVSAENVTIEILQNTQGEYYISYENDLIECVEDECTFDVANHTTNSTSITDFSKDDMKKIAQYVALEIDTDDFDSGINETFMITSLAKTREDTTDNLRAYIAKTIMPEVEKFDEVEQKLAASEILVADLQAKAGSHDATISAKDTEIKLLEDKVEKSDTLVLGCIGLVILAVIMSGHRVRDGLDILKNRGK